MAQPEEHTARGLLASQLPFVSPPPSLKLTDKSQDEWKIFNQQYEIFEKIVELDKTKYASYQCAMFLNIHCRSKRSCNLQQLRSY